MIYDQANIAAPIRQGDIFVQLPRVEISLTEIAVLEKDNSAVKTNWSQVLAKGEVVAAILPVRPVIAIVVTQDCDNTHGSDITLCEIRNFKEVEGMSKDTKNPKGWMKIITQQARKNLKWFYLPACEAIGLPERSAVDFRITIRVPRVDLENMRVLRKGRLNDVADEHFRERLAEFYRRYPYDEWYSLDTEELAKYQENYPEAKPFPWQNP